MLLSVLKPWRLRGKYLNYRSQAVVAEFSVAATMAPSEAGVVVGVCGASRPLAGGPHSSGSSRTSMQMTVPAFHTLDKGNHRSWPGSTLMPRALTL